MRQILALTALSLALAGCGHAQRSAVAIEVNGDIANETATVTCKESTTGTCHLLFQTGTTTKSASAAAGASTTVAGLPAGSSFCGGYTPPELATCKPIVLLNGHQVIRREHTVRN